MITSKQKHGSIFIGITTEIIWWLYWPYILKCLGITSRAACLFSCLRIRHLIKDIFPAFWKCQHGHCFPSSLTRKGTLYSLDASRGEFEKVQRIRPQPLIVFAEPRHISWAEIQLYSPRCVCLSWAKLLRTVSSAWVKSAKRTAATTTQRSTLEITQRELNWAHRWVVRKREVRDNNNNNSVFRIPTNEDGLTKKKEKCA